MTEVNVQAGAAAAAAVAVAVPEAPLPPPAALGTVPLMPSPVAASRDSSCSTIPDDE